MTAPVRDDRGSGLLGTSIAVLVFVLFMATAAHLLTAMYATSTVMAVSTDAARSVAARDVSGSTSVTAAQRHAEANARANLGRIGTQVHYVWDVSATTVRLRVILDQPWRLGPGWSPIGAFAHVDRTIVMQRELPR